MNIEDKIKNVIRDVPNFPKEGIIFKDITPIMMDAQLSNEILDHKYVYEEIGYNLKPLDMQASIGLVQLKKLDMIIEKRKYNFSKLMKIFEPSIWT